MNKCAKITIYYKNNAEETLIGEWIDDDIFLAIYIDGKEGKIVKIPYTSIIKFEVEEVNK